MGFYFFSDNAELLGGTQTYVGVMIALIVLCIFNDKNDGNFLRRIAASLHSGLAEANRSYIKKLQGSLNKPVDIPGDDTGILKDSSGWIKLAQGEDSKVLLSIVDKSNLVPATFFNKAQEKIKNGTDAIEELNKRDEDAYIQSYLLVLTLFVFTLDALHIGICVGAFILLLTALQIIAFSTSMWIVYFKNQNPIACTQKDGSKGALSKFVTVATIFLFGHALMSFCVGWFDSLLMVIIVCLLSFIAFSIAFPVYRWFHMLPENYNNRFVFKHAFYSVLLTTAGAIIIFWCMSASWLADLCGIRCQDFFSRWCDNMNILLNIRYARIFFCAVVAFFGFFCPIALGLLSTKFLSFRIKKQIETVYEEAQRDAMNIRKEYIEILKKIFKEQKT